MVVTISVTDAVPLVANVLGWARFMSPIREVIQIRRDKQLGELNCFPFAAAILNTTGWSVYAILKPNFYIFTGDAPGLICSLWMLLSLYPYSSYRNQEALNIFLTGSASLWMLLTLVTFILQDSPKEGAIVPMWGWAVSVTQVLLMASPLSTMYKAVKERSSASFHPLLCIMGLISSTLWAVYALVIKDIFVAVPNLLGGLVSAVSVMVCIFLPRSLPETPRQREQVRARAVELEMELGR